MYSPLFVVVFVFALAVSQNIYIYWIQCKRIIYFLPRILFISLFCLPMLKWLSSVLILILSINWFWSDISSFKFIARPFSLNWKSAFIIQNILIIFYLYLLNIYTRRIKKTRTRVVHKNVSQGYEDLRWPESKNTNE